MVTWDGNYWKKTIKWLMLWLVSGCVEPYSPPQIEAPNNFLVVDGYLNSGQGTSRIKLSRTQNIANSSQPVAELHAQVAFEGEQGNLLTLAEQGDGLYILANTTIDYSQKYRLQIKTVNGKEYLSDFIPVQQTPAIDSITWKVENEGIQIYANTHDADNNTRYYRWEYEETYEFTSAFESVYDYEYSTNTLLPKDEETFTCWQTVPSTDIIIGNSIKLSQDVIRDFPLIFIPGESEKIGIRYSILVKQYGISQEVYQYLQLLEKNTENLGTLFDPQPSQLTGNIRCVTDSEEPVIGHFYATTATEKRIFIDRSQLPVWNTKSINDACKADTVPTWKSAEYLDVLDYMFIERRMYIRQFDDSGNIINRETLGIVISKPPCIDCRLRGTNIKPDFWE